MIHLIADERHACAHAHGELTIGSRGIPVQVGLSDDFDGLAVTICFQAGTERAEVVWYEGEEINVPPQCLTKEGERLLVGVYGAKADGTVVIPTIWATAGIVKRGTDLTGASPLDPEPDWTAQVQSIAAEAIETANAVKAAADAGEFDGYSPSASVTKSGDTATITITDKDGTTTASIRDGYDTSGSVVQDGTTAIITLTDHDGTTRAEVHDGISPSASVTQTEMGATVTVTDRSGTTTAQLTNGATGQQGERGPQGPKGDTGDGATRIEYGSGIILVQCDADGRTKAWGGGFEIRAYVGAERQACTAAINYAPSWLTINVTNNASGTPTVRYSWQQGQAASNATVSMTVTTTDVSGAEVTYPCTLNVTTVLDGAAGADGEDGYGFVPVDGTFVPIHTNPDNTTRAGVHYLIFEAYRGSEKLDVTSVTFSGPSWITASHNNHGMLTLRWPDGENLGGSANCGITATVDDHGTTRTESFPIVVGAVKDGADGYSPSVTVSPITGGHEVTVTDAGGSQSFDVMDGRDGQKLTKALSGTLLTASDAYAAPPVDVTVYGNSTQAGTPTPDAPVPILSVDAMAVTLAGRNVWGGSQMATDVLAKVTGAESGSDADGEYVSAGAGRLGGVRLFEGPFKENTAYTLVLKIRKDANNGTNINFRYTDGTLGTLSIPSSADVTTTGTYLWTSNASKTLAAIVGRNQGSTTYLYTDGCGLFEGAMGVSDFEPYVGTSAPIDLQGHELRSLPDGTRDELTLTPEGTAYRATITQRVGVTTTAATDGITGTVGVDVMSTTGEMTDGPTVTYALATERTIDLGTVTLPALSAPDMTAWADGGSATPTLSLTYERDIGIVLADMQAEVEHVWAQLAPVEQETATANHAVGTYIVLGGTLCKVTRAIATGEAVAIGTNVAATTVAAELLAIQA